MKSIAKGFLTRLLVGCLIVFAGLFALLMYGLYCAPSKHQISEQKRAEWSKDFRVLGLADVPEKAEHSGGVWTDGSSGFWMFRAYSPAVDQWLSDSPSIRTAEVRTKPGKRAYLITSLPGGRACHVVVRAEGEKSHVVVSAMSPDDLEGGSGTKPRSAQDARRRLLDCLEHTPWWSGK